MAHQFVTPQGRFMTVSWSCTMLAKGFATKHVLKAAKDETIESQVRALAIGPRQMSVSWYY
ncbi:hypothetical protein E2562_022673 [Oryza meyeriana var. granulata]|uniref:Uncharacterized protein n=1 Tax=Oryza meyeriana var. granulata TaxID=110450 RepID=A0A6G1E2C3_9ORYZ|nr:hypothetical protein E2562_022673 [Oryza meyeriana var. granulata]